MEGVWFAQFSWSSPWRLTRVGRMWRTSIYNLCILLVEVGSSGNKDGGKE